MSFLKKKAANFNIYYVLVFAFIVRILFSPFGTLSLDQNTFIAWSNRLDKVGLANFYNSWSDYLPGYLYILAILAKIKAVIPLPEVILYKLPAILSDLLTGYFIYKIVKKIKTEKLALIASAAYVFNPAILANSSLWGQVDSLTSLFAIMSIYFFDKKFLFSSIFLAIGVLIKPQAALAVIPILFLMTKNKWKMKKVIEYGLIGLTAFLLMFLPFVGKNNFFEFVFERLSLVFGQYPYTSINSFNFWGLFGFWKADNLLFQFMIIPVLVGIYVNFVKKVKLKKGKEYVLLALVFLAGFLFMTRLHERHLLPVFASLAVSASFYPLLWITYVGLSVSYVANLFYSYNWIANDFLAVFPPFVVKLFIIINLALFVFGLLVVFGKIKKEKFLKVIKEIFGKRKKIMSEKNMFKKVTISNKNKRIFLIIILSFSFITRIISLGSPPDEYFDEVYHAFTARRALNNDPKAWEWWNPHPTGFAYEWTHPPVAKLGMVLGMSIFGENAFGWRIVQVVLGTLSVFLVYLLSKEVFKDELVGILSASLLSLSGLFLVMSRIGMNDIYLVFFVLLTLYLSLKEKNFLASVALGFAFASKWSALWFLPILVVSKFIFGKKIKPSLFWFVIIPPLIYLASYIPMFLTGHDLGTFVGVQKQMWWYHTKLDATHAYTSAWWSWPVMARPVYLFTTNEVGEKVSRIYATGNPAIFWGGFLSIIYSVFFVIRKRLRCLGFVIFAYIMFFAGWALSPRIMFLYHYLPSIPFLAITTGFVLRKNPKLISYFLIITLAMFMYFYPHWVGLNIPLWLDKSYYWFPSWR